MPLRLDQNRIAIRERNLLEIMDLALLVIRAQGFTLLGAFAVGAMPMILLNAWLLKDLIDPTVIEDEPFPAQYLFAMVWLIALEIPLATAPATVYLGEALFQDKPGLRPFLRTLRASLPQLICYQAGLRGLFMALALLGVYLHETWLQVLGAPLVIYPFVRQTYLNEVILLERNPLFPGRRKAMTTSRRAKVLHADSFGNLLAYWVASIAMGLLMTVSLWLSLWILLSQLLGGWHSAYVLYLVYLPLGVWAVIGYFTVVRFLSYLDLRIRREGWEVELVLRAEADRLTSQFV